AGGNPDSASTLRPPDVAPSSPPEAGAAKPATTSAPGVAIASAGAPELPDEQAAARPAWAGAPGVAVANAEGTEPQGWDTAMTPEPDIGQHPSTSLGEAAAALSGFQTAEIPPGSSLNTGDSGPGHDPAIGGIESQLPSGSDVPAIGTPSVTSGFDTAQQTGQSQQQPTPFDTSPSAPLATH